MKIIRFAEESALRWDALVPQTAQGVFLHSRKFLAYHRDRFEDVSLLIEDDKARLRCLFPAAVALDDGTQVVSHPGITYGGLLHHTSCKADEVLGIMAGIRAWYREHGFRSLLYKVVPPHIHEPVVQSDIYALWREDGILVRRDLWNVLDLCESRKLSAGHKWSYKKAVRSGLVVDRVDADGYALFHALLADGLMEHHDARPAHTLEELLELQRRFPQEIQLWGCRAPDGELLAGAWMFKLRAKCWHTQYITTGARGRDLFATDLLLEGMVEQAMQAGVRYFSFGNSTDESGGHLNTGLFSFKSGFGAGAVTQDFYEVRL